MCYEEYQTSRSIKLKKFCQRSSRFATSNARLVATTIKGYKTTPTANPESIEENGSKTCSGITVDVKLSEKPTGTVTAKFPNNAGAATITATEDKTDPETYIISGIILKEDGNLDGLQLLVDGVALLNDNGVTNPTLTCLKSGTESSSSSVSSSSESSSSESSAGDTPTPSETTTPTPTDTPPVIKSISVSSPSMEPTVNAGQKFCTGVKVDFELDKTVQQLSYLEPKYNSMPATGKNTVSAVDATKPIYFFSLDVSVNGTLDDLYILYNKAAKITLPSKITFKCQDALTSTDPTTVTSISTSKSSATSKDQLCSEVKVDFTLDNPASAITDLTVSSASITGTPTISQSDSTSSSYSATVTVKEGGDLSDFVVNFKGTPLSSSSTVTFKCDKESSNDSKGDDGSTSSSLSANSIVAFCFTVFLILFLN
ncbi:hypothetical protein ACTA71_009802 [Dictyostelium dimigraforme]